jgi:endonuclease-8
MPEGPSIVMFANEFRALKLTGKKITGVEGNARIDKHALKSKKLSSIRTWGKHLLFCFPGLTLRIHFLMFGTFLINARKKTPLKLRLRFGKTELNFYTCSIVLLEGKLKDHYDWSEDILSKKWSDENALEKLKSESEKLICDNLMNQEIFSGVGNVIKNEVLWRNKVHPESLTAKLPSKKRREIVEDVTTFAHEFLKWRKQNKLKAHLQVYHKETCERCGSKIHHKETGTSKRNSFFCAKCQKKY